MHRAFDRFAAWAASAIGSSWAFALCVALIIAWLALGPLAHWGNTWQLWCNTVSTIATTAIVFLLQHTTNRESRALHLKLDELLRANKRARTGLVDLESAGEDELERLAQEFSRLRERAQKDGPRGDDEDMTRWRAVPDASAADDDDDDLALAED
jgi:low affinity Fe/Cu permease